jgi:hypothetical protein
MTRLHGSLPALRIVLKFVGTNNDYLNEGKIKNGIYRSVLEGIKYGD